MAQIVFGSKKDRKPLCKDTVHFFSQPTNKQTNKKDNFLLITKFTIFTMNSWVDKSGIYPMSLWQHYPVLSCCLCIVTFSLFLATSIRVCFQNLSFFTKTATCCHLGLVLHPGYCIASALSHALCSTLWKKKPLDLEGDIESQIQM